MMGCCSNFGVSHVVTVSKEAVLRRLGNQSLSSINLSFRNLLKCATFPVFCGNECRGYVTLQKTERIVMMSMSQQPAESQFTVTTIEVSEGGGENVLENGHKGLDNESASKTDGYENNGVMFEGGGGNGNFESGVGGGGGGGGSNGDEEEEEFGPMLKYDEVMRETEARGYSSFRYVRGC